MNAKTPPAITPETVAAILRDDFDAVSKEALGAILAAIVASGDDPPCGLVESLPVTVRAWDDGSDRTGECDHGDDYGSYAESLWEDADYGDGDYRVTVRWSATDAAGDELESGTFEVEGKTPEPPCSAADEHDWTSEGEGGLKENPGVWSVGGTAMVFASHCRLCGLRRVERTTGSQCNPGDCDTTEYTTVDSWCEKCQKEKCEC